MEFHFLVFVATIVHIPVRITGSLCLTKGEIHVRSNQGHGFTVFHEIATELESFFSEKIQIGNEVGAQLYVVARRIDHKSVFCSVIVGFLNENFARTNVGAIVPRV